MSPVADLLDQRRVVLVLGAGGVGKTTVAASLALAAGRAGGRIAILTVDPSRSLASALGLGADQNHATIDVGEGSLDVTVLDPASAWDQLVTRELGSATSLIDNAMYRAVTRNFVHAHDFIAIETLHQLIAAGHDLVIVDTPPSKRAIEFLMAPERLASFFENRALGWFTGTAANPVISVGTRPLVAAANLVLGRGFVTSLAEFFGSVRPLADPIVARAKSVDLLFREGDAAAVVVVTSTEPAAIEQCMSLGDELATRGVAWEATIVNRVRQQPPGDPPKQTAIERDLTAVLAGDEGHGPAAFEGLARRATEAWQRSAVAAQYDERAIAPLRDGPPLVIVGDRGPGDLHRAHLASIGDEIVA